MPVAGGKVDQVSPVRRDRDGRGDVVGGVELPAQLAGPGIDGIEEVVIRTKIERPVHHQRVRAHHRPAGDELPPLGARAGVQRVHPAVGGPHVDQVLVDERG